MGKYSYSSAVFSGKGNIEIFTQQWIPERAKAGIILVHGLGEHSGRYSAVIEALSGKSVSFFALDHRGHGKSKGLKGHVDSFMDYIFDLKIYINSIKSANPGLPLFMLGHSLGGAIACRYALTYQNDLNGLILSAPGLIPATQLSFFERIYARFLSFALPSYSMSNGLDPAALSHDEDIVAAYIQDSLVHDLITPRFSTELSENAQFCLEKAFQLRLPLLCIHGTDDRIYSAKGTEILCQRADSEDKMLLLFPNLYHETMNELRKDRQKVLSSISKWITDRVAKKKEPFSSHQTIDAKTKPAASKKPTSEKKKKTVEKKK